MKNIILFDNLNLNDTEYENAREIKELALKQLSRGRFDIEKDKVSVNILTDDQISSVLFTNTISLSDFRKEVYLMADEPSMEFLYDKTFRDEGTLVETLREYKSKYYVLGSELGKCIWFKLYSNSELNNNMRMSYHASWIDYEKQLLKSNVIYDEAKLNGLWAMHSEMLSKCLNEECEEHYGSHLFTLKPIPDCYYLDDESEIIGDRYEVIDKFDMHNYEDVGRLIGYIMSYEKTNIKDIEDKYEKQLFSIKDENDRLHDRQYLMEKTQKRYIIIFSILCVILVYLLIVLGRLV